MAKPKKRSSARRERSLLPPVSTEPGSSSATTEPGSPSLSTEPGSSSVGTVFPVTRELGVRLYEYMLRTWFFEERVLTLYRQGKIFGGLYTGSGNEAVAVGSAMALEAGDMVAPSHRGIGVHFVRGENFRDMLLQLAARKEGGTRGRDNAAHQCSIERGVIGNISHMGAWTPLAAGAALAFVIKEQENVALSYIGDGSSSLGIFHEVLNLSSVLDLPFVLVIENNQWAYSTPNALQFRCKELSSRAAGYGISGLTIDGSDVEAVYTAVKEAVENARRNRRPALIEAVTLRLRGHSAADEAEYVPEAMRKEWEAKHPVTTYAKRLAERGWLSEEQEAKLRAQIEAELDEAVEFALARPLPEPQTALGGVYRENEAAVTAPWKERSGKLPEQPLSYIDAVHLAMHDELKADPRVFLMGEDVAGIGGVFKASKGFLQEFGRKRIIDTPIAENGFVGMGIGAAVWGLRPIIEIQFADFVTEAFTQIVYNAAKMHYRAGVNVPLVIRMPVGAGTGSGPFHSANPEAWFCHVPGLKVVAPATPTDAYALLRAAVQDLNPVLFLEHKYLYRRIKEQIAPVEADYELGWARIARRGDDASVITYGAMLHRALEAAEELQREGYSVEVIDLRSLLPWDKQTVLESAKRTGRVLVLHEAPITAGFGGELAATIGEAVFEYLDAPILRLASEDTPVPFAPTLEQFHMPGVGDIVDKLRFLLDY